MRRTPPGPKQESQVANRQIPFPAINILLPMHRAIGTDTDLVKVRDANCRDKFGLIRGCSSKRREKLHQKPVYL
jgi:hypothetical protein